MRLHANTRTCPSALEEGIRLLGVIWTKPCIGHYSFKWMDFDAQQVQNNLMGPAVETARILIVDDSAIMRRVLRAVLDGFQNAEVIGEASNGEEAIQKVHSLQPDLVIMDVNMPVLDGLTAAEVIKKFRPRTEILMFSMYRVREFIEAAKSLGLSGFVPKEDASTALLNAVDAIIHHHTYFPPDAAEDSHGSGDHP